MAGENKSKLTPLAPTSLAALACKAKAGQAPLTEHSHGPSAATLKWYWVSKGLLLMVLLACPYVLWGGYQKISTMRSPPTNVEINEATFQLSFPGGGRSGRGRRQAIFFKNGSSVFTADCQDAMDLCGPKAFFKGHTVYVGKNIQVLEVWERGGVLKHIDVVTPTGDVLSITNGRADEYQVQVFREWRNSKLSCLVMAASAVIFFLVMRFKVKTKGEF